MVAAVAEPETIGRVFPLSSLRPGTVYTANCTVVRKQSCENRSEWYLGVLKSYHLPKWPVATVASMCTVGTIDTFGKGGGGAGGRYKKSARDLQYQLWGFLLQSLPQSPIMAPKGVPSGHLMVP